MAVRGTGSRLSALLVAVGVIAALAPPAFAEEVGLVDPDTGQWHLREDEASQKSFYFGHPNDIPFAGDWDCDGTDTPGLYRQSDGFVYLRNTNSQGVANIEFFFGNPGDVPLAGDFNGNGCDTVSIYRPSEARFYIINELGSSSTGLGAADFSFLFGNPGDKPFTGDFDGDGIDEIGLHRESTGFVYSRNTLSTGIADSQFFFGDPGDRIVAGDWGPSNGVDSPAIYRPNDAAFYLRYTNTQGNADEAFFFGEGDWLPVAGDWSPTSPEEGDNANVNLGSDSGSEESDLPPPPDSDEHGGEPVIAPSTFEMGGTAATGAPATISDESLEVANTLLESIYPADTEGDEFTAQYCQRNRHVEMWWGLYCETQGYFSGTWNWLSSSSLPSGVGMIRGFIGNFVTGCSGTLIARNVVLTAAHCLFHNGQQIPAFEFIPSLYGHQGSKPSWFGTRRLFPAYYLANSTGSNIHDYALIVLEQDNLGRHAGDVVSAVPFFMLGGANPSSSVGYKEWDVTRFAEGYPIEGYFAGYGSGWDPGNSVYIPSTQDPRAWPRYCQSSDGWYYHVGNGYYVMGFGCSLNGGMSGGPVFQQVNGSYYVASVVSKGAHVVTCSSQLGGICGNSNRYFMRNVWGPPLLDTTGGYGFDDLYWAAFNTSINGAVNTATPTP